MTSIFISIKPIHLNRIVSREKDHEFRSKIPKQSVSIMYVYESSPTCKLKYIMQVETPIEYPNKINTLCYGNNIFNEGMKKGKFAYPIISLYKLKTELSLSFLRSTFDFNPPQSFMYTSTNKELKDYVDNLPKEKLF